MSGAKKITLNEFNGTDWKGFMQKTKGTYSAKKTDSGRTYWTILQTDDPRVEGKKQIKTIVEEIVQRQVTVHMGVVPMVDQTGNPVKDTVSKEVCTEEDQATYKIRCDEWDLVMCTVWCDLLQCCTGEPGAQATSPHPRKQRSGVRG
jgi:hypothetical protein